MKLNTQWSFPEYDETKIIGLSLTFLVEGFETSSTLMAFCLYEVNLQIPIIFPIPKLKYLTLFQLAMNPQIQKQVQDEIETVMAKNDQKLTIECLQQMTFLDQVLNETLRIHPPAMDLKKIVTKPYKIPPQYQNVDAKSEVVLAPGTVVTVPIYSIQL
jgi:cytochrome P450